MKRIVCLLLAILMVFGSVAALASCGECTEHVDANHDGKCDNDVPQWGYKTAAAVNVRT